MPTAERYARYRADQTTIWVSKTTAAFLARERESSGEGAAAVLDRLLNELRRLRRGTRTGAGSAGVRKAAATAGKASARPAKAAKTTTRPTSKTAAKSAAKSAAKTTTKTTSRSAAKSPAGKARVGRAAKATSRGSRRSA